MTALSDPALGMSPAADGRVATMREVAALAGVSVKTVSRVVRGEPGVSMDLTVKVTEAMRLLDYRHNLAASNLRRGGQKTAAIGLILEDVANPFAAALHRSVEDIARSRGTLVFAASNDEQPGRQGEVLDALVTRRVDGLIVMPVGYDHEVLVRERRRGLPMVFVDRLASGADLDSVTSDNRDGARAAVRHLTARGHRRIAFVGDLRGIWTAAERYAGYVEALALDGVALDPALVHQDVHAPASAEEVAGALLDDPAVAPTAFFGGQNLMTIGIVRAIQRRGLQHRVALVGFDDLELADLLDPGLTVVAQDPAAIGRAAAEQLFARLDGDPGPGKHIVVPTRLVMRGSGELPPGRPGAEEGS
jgi:LacI family transcriptional regulator